MTIFTHTGGATITNSNFSFNSVSGYMAGAGGMYYYLSDTLVMNNCVFTNNTVRHQPFRRSNRLRTNTAHVLGTVSPLIFSSYSLPSALCSLIFS